MRFKAALPKVSDVSWSPNDTAEPVSRREVVTTLLGALGAATVVGCAEDGTGPAAIEVEAAEHALTGTSLRFVDAIGTTPVTGTSQNLRGLTGSDTARLAVVLGYKQRGDGGGGTFVWIASPTAVDNGGTIIVAGQSLGSTTPGPYWKRIRLAPFAFHRGDIMTLNVLAFGAVGDGVTDDTAAFIAAVAATSPGGTLLVPRPTNFYLTTNEIVLTRGISLRGESAGDNFVTSIQNINGTTPVIRIAPTHGYETFVIQGITTIGGSHGIHWDGNGTQPISELSTLRDVECGSALQHGVFVDGVGMIGTKFGPLRCYGNSGDGIRIVGPNPLNAASWSTIRVGNNLGHGLYVVQVVSPGDTSFSDAFHIDSLTAEQNRRAALYLEGIQLALSSPHFEINDMSNTDGYEIGLNTSYAGGSTSNICALNIYGGAFDAAGPSNVRIKALNHFTHVLLDGVYTSASAIIDCNNKNTSVALRGSLIAASVVNNLTPVMKWNSTTSGAGRYELSTGASITSGSAVPTAAETSGSLYLRTAGNSGDSLYVRASEGSWFRRNQFPGGIYTEADNVGVLFYPNPYDAHVGSPENYLPAAPGCLYVDKVNGEIYIKKSGTGNTGWKLLTHA